MQSEIKYAPSYSLAIVTLTAGESIQAEAGSMVSMSPSIEMTDGMEPSSEIHPKCTLRSRPWVGPAARAMYWAKTSRGRPPRTKIAPRLRMRGVKMSPRSSA